MDHVLYYEFSSNGNILFSESIEMAWILVKLFFERLSHSCPAALGIPDQAENSKSSPVSTHLSAAPNNDLPMSFRGQYLQEMPIELSAGVTCLVIHVVQRS